MTEHTKEPWRVEENTTLIWGACNPDDSTSYGMGPPIADAKTAFSYYAGKTTFDADMGEANARGIVACVNACAGIPTTELEKIKEMYVEGDKAESRQVRVLMCMKIIVGEQLKAAGDRLEVWLAQHR